VIKSRIIGWVEHVARKGRGVLSARFWWGNLRKRDQWGEPGVDEKIIIRWIVGSGMLG
jgi:hypothetical protein